MLDHPPKKKRGQKLLSLEPISRSHPLKSNLNSLPTGGWWPSGNLQNNNTLLPPSISFLLGFHIFHHLSSHVPTPLLYSLLQWSNFPLGLGKGYLNILYFPNLRGPVLCYRLQLLSAHPPKTLHTWASRPHLHWRWWLTQMSPASRPFVALVRPAEKFLWIILIIMLTVSTLIFFVVLLSARDLHTGRWWWDLCTEEVVTLLSFMEKEFLIPRSKNTLHWKCCMYVSSGENVYWICDSRMLLLLLMEIELTLNNFRIFIFFYNDEFIKKKKA